MITLSKENFSLLISLQGKDKVLDKFRADLEKIPGDIAGLRDSVEQEKNRLTALKEKVNQLQVSRKQKEMDLTGAEEAIRKHHQELNQIKTNDAYKALLTQIETAKGNKAHLEDEILSLLEEMDGVVHQEKKEQQELKQIEALTAQKVQDLEVKKQELEKNLAANQVEREAIAAQVPPEALSQYEHVRARKKGIAVVPVRADTCGGCHMTLTPQTVVNVKIGQGLVLCDNCQRILYLPT